MLTNLLLECTSLGSQNPEGKQLITSFFPQSFLNIKVKLKHLERGPINPQAEVLALAFKVYQGRDEKACKQKK